MFDKFRNRNRGEEQISAQEGPSGRRIFGIESLGLFAKETMNYGMIKNGTVEKLEAHFESLNGTVKRLHSLVNEELGEKANLIRDGRVDRTWIYELKMHIQEYERIIKVLEQSHYSKYDKCKINVSIIEDFFGKVGRKSGAIGMEARNQTFFGRGLNENFRELVEIDHNIAEIWNGNMQRDKKFENLVEKLQGRYVLVEELSAKIRRAKQDADEGDTSGIRKVKESVQKISSKQQLARDSLMRVQEELEALFKPINGRVSEKYDHEFKFDRHSVGNFIRNNKEILGHFDIFVAKVRSLRGMLLASKLDLDEKLRQGALAATQKILEKCGESVGTNTVENVAKFQSSTELYGLIKKEKGLAEYIAKKENEIKGMGAAIEKIREPMLSAAIQVERLVGEQNEVKRRLHPLRKQSRNMFLRCTSFQ